MAMFSIHTPKSVSTCRKQINIQKAYGTSHPIGHIGESNNFQYGYDGNTYYVSEGVFSYKVTTAKMTLDEAKQLFNALNWSDDITGKLPKEITQLITAARKKKLFGDALMFFFIDCL